MISLPSQIQSLLDAFGIHLDAESFTNLMKHLRVDQMSWKVRTGLVIALGLLVQNIVANRNKQAAALASAAAEVAE